MASVPETLARAPELSPTVLDGGTIVDSSHRLIGSLGRRNPFAEKTPRATIHAPRSDEPRFSSTRDEQAPIDVHRGIHRGEPLASGVAVACLLHRLAGP